MAAVIPSPQSVFNSHLPLPSPLRSICPSPLCFTCPSPLRSICPSLLTFCVQCCWLLGNEVSRGQRWERLNIILCNCSCSCHQLKGLHGPGSNFRITVLMSLGGSPLASLVLMFPWLLVSSLPMVYLVHRSYWTNGSTVVIVAVVVSCIVYIVSSY